ncbi:dihydrodipicolinate synthase family protein [Allorhizocola rhizosphaerae]|uniref:dihydrodipicolinate synthase family protein n=1 Tax=Allorhizocola rhizosphaerae TaxID=1872709 RepID=UPI003CCC7473
MLHVPLITPFDATGAVAYDALEALANEVLASGAAGIVALGTTAEPGSLSDSEKRTVVDLIAGVCVSRRAHLIVGAGVEHADATAALALVPPFVRPGEAGVIAYFDALAEASPVPLIIYHVPYRTGQPLSAAAIRRLAEIPGVVGMKYAPGGIDADTIALLADPPFQMLCGDDLFLAPMLALGAHGGILASAHIATAQFAELVSAPSRELGHRLARLSSALFAEPNPTVIKGVLHAQGRIPTPDVRLPLLPAAKSNLTLPLRESLASST